MIGRNLVEFIENKCLDASTAIECAKMKYYDNQLTTHNTTTTSSATPKITFDNGCTMTVNEILLECNKTCLKLYRDDKMSINEVITFGRFTILMLTGKLPQNKVEEYKRLSAIVIPVAEAENNMSIFNNNNAISNNITNTFNTNGHIGFDTAAADRANAALHNAAVAAGLV